MRGIFRTIAVIGVLFLAPAIAFGANGDTLNIGGIVPLVLTLTVTPDTNADNLTLHADPGDTPTVEIARIDVSTNNSAGWELYAYSANAEAGTTSVLMNADTDEIGYDVTFDSLDAEAGGPILTGGLLLKQVTDRTPETDSPLQITYAQAPDHPAGYFSDQLTIVLRAK